MMRRSASDRAQPSPLPYAFAYSVEAGTFHIDISLEGSAQWLADPKAICNHVPGVEAFELVCRVLPGAQEAGKPTVSIRMEVESMFEFAGKDGHSLLAALNASKISSRSWMPWNG